MARPRVHFESAREHLAEHGETRAGELAAAIGLDPGTLTSALKTPLREGIVLKRLEGRDVFYRLPIEGEQPADDTDDEPHRFYGRLDTDGDLDLYGLVELNDGGHRVPAENVARLRQLLRGEPA